MTRYVRVCMTVLVLCETMYRLGAFPVRCSGVYTVRFIGKFDRASWQGLVYQVGRFEKRESKIARQTLATHVSSWAIF